MRFYRLAGLLAGILMCVSAVGQTAQDPPTDVPAQRARLARERAQAEARYQEQAKVCRGKFAVNDCLRKAEAERRTVTADLRRQEMILNDLDRKRQTAERRRSLDERAAQKAKDDEERSRKALERSPREAQTPGPQGQARAPGQPRGAPLPQGKPRSAPPQLPQPPSPEETARKARENEEKLKEAQAHKDAVLERAARRKDDRAKPLPVPP